MKKELRTRVTALAVCAALAAGLGAAALAGEEDDWLPPGAGGARPAARAAETTESETPEPVTDTTESETPEPVSDTTESEPDKAETATDTSALSSYVETQTAEPEPPAAPEPDSGAAQPDTPTITDSTAAPAVTEPAAPTVAEPPAAVPEEGDSAWLPPAGADTAAGTSNVQTGTDAEPVEPDLSWQAGPDDGGAAADPEPDLNSLQRERQERDQRKLESLLEQVTSEAPVLDSVVFGNVEALTRTRNLTILGLEENIAGIQSLDYEKLENQMRDSLNGIARSQSMMLMAGAAEPMAVNSAMTSLQTTYNSLYDQFKAIRDGDLQKSNADIVKQLRNAEDQLVMGSEALYIALVSMDAQRVSLERQLNALNRTVEEMELRYSLGQISALALGEVTTGRASLVSGLETLNMNLRTYKMQLQTMLGASPTGELRLAGLPAVTEKQMNAMDVEADLTAAMGKSYELYAAALTLDDARTAFDNSGKQYGYNPRNAMYQQAAHTWTAAQGTYNNSLRSYELKFRTLYEKVHDDYQILNNAKTSLKQQEASYAASELKHELGNLSKNALLSAQDDLQTAKEAVTSASNTLFSDYNNYCWAVQHGILN